jgi:4-coumarate--CoA ligase
LPYSLYYGLAMWGTFRNGGIVSCANPTYTTGEFLYQIQMCSQSYKVKAIVVHPDSLQIAQEAAAQAGLPTSCICLIEPPAKGKAAVPTVEDLVKKHAKSAPIKHFKLSKGQAKTKVAFLSMSSGTTGLPKAVVICHYSVTTNTIQAVASRKGSLEGGKSKTIAVLPFYHIYGLVGESPVRQFHATDRAQQSSCMPSSTPAWRWSSCRSLCSPTF